MKKRSIQAQSLLKISLITFSFASLASFCVLVGFTAAGLASPSIEILPIATLALSLGVFRLWALLCWFTGYFHVLCTSWSRKWQPWRLILN